MKELNEDIYFTILQLSKAADNHLENGEKSAALLKYWNAYDLIPEPKKDSETSTWLLTAIGNINFLNEDYKAGVANLTSAMRCPDAVGNAFMHLRLGQCQLEVGNLRRAENELARAYTIDGKSIFNKEDKKYFEFLKTKIDIQPKKKKWWKLLKSE
ncbi:hypothetical protein [Cellulophaga fucicola]|uniref:Tetratricopeptide repeat-containing protein n=1 Tax=Cellulophaga fucicola TaxID=76595 RepID=A0A1K1NUN5_9FLAO|nr:hypothetical protein [Cellulophaga fucicola]SFW39020.1 hypothetical protein SAMN05660313_01380 [Cellulophaga fucicola]